LQGCLLSLVLAQGFCTLLTALSCEVKNTHKSVWRARTIHIHWQSVPLGTETALMTWLFCSYLSGSVIWHLPCDVIEDEPHATVYTSVCYVRLWAVTRIVGVIKFLHLNCIGQWYSVLWTTLGFRERFLVVPQAHSLCSEIGKHSFYIFNYIFFFPVFVHNGIWFNTILCFKLCVFYFLTVCFRSFFFIFALQSTPVRYGVCVKT
jgi:hypothetical protein